MRPPLFVYAISEIISSVENKVLDAMLILENQFGCLDDLDIEIDTYALTPEFITQDEGGEVVSEELCSDLLKSNCLITGQPDWGSVYIRYTGRKISHEGLLRYIISMRTHNEFHEHCVERIFTDIANRCSVTYLEVRAFYTRRGGLDINPVRATCELPCESARLIRQ